MRTRKQTRVDLDLVDIRATLDRLGMHIKDDRGATITAFCIFHKDGDVPNLKIRSDSGGVFHCFSCGASGNILHIVERMLKVDRKGAWDFISGVGEVSQTAESIKRLLDKREKGNVDYIESMHKHIDDLYNLTKRPPGLLKALRQAELERDVDRYFSLCDPVHEMLLLMIDDLHVRMEEDYRFTIKDDPEAYNTFVDEVKKIWEYAVEHEYFRRYPKLFQPMTMVGKSRWIAKEWEIPEFVACF